MSAERTFLVTGSTGAIGSAVIPLLLEDAGTDVYVLLRADSDGHLQQRRRELLAYWGSELDGARTARIHVVRGDVSHPRLGLSPDRYEHLCACITNIIHAAGDVKLNQPLSTARASAVTAVERVLELAHDRARRGMTPKIEHLSTVGVAGRRSGMIPEAPLEAGFGYHNTYEQAKAEAEAIALAASAAGVPLTVHRPSMVVGDAHRGRIIRFQVFYYLAPFIAGNLTRGVLPRFKDVRLDIVPVDHVARAIRMSAYEITFAGKILHLCSGPDAAIPLKDLGEELRRFFSAHGHKVYRPRYISPRAIRGAAGIGAALGPKRIRGSLGTLPYFLDYLEEAQVFANEATAGVLDPRGLSVPQPSTYLDKVLEYWMAHRAPSTRGGNVSKRHVSGHQSAH